MKRFSGVKVVVLLRRRRSSLWEGSLAGSWVDREIVGDGKVIISFHNAGSGSSMPIDMIHVMYRTNMRSERCRWRNRSDLLPFPPHRHPSSQPTSTSSSLSDTKLEISENVGLDFTWISPIHSWISTAWKQEAMTMMVILECLMVPCYYHCWRSSFHHSATTTMHFSTYIHTLSLSLSDDDNAYFIWPC